MCKWLPYYHLLPMKLGFQCDSKVDVPPSYSLIFYLYFLHCFFYILTNTKFKHVTSHIIIVGIHCLRLHLMLLTFIWLLTTSICVHI